MAKNKTTLTDNSVEAFLNKITGKQKREDAFAIVDLMKKVTKAEPKMWGSAIVGFGSRRLKYDSGRELDWFVTGFSPRKTELTLYVGLGGQDSGDLLKKLGKYKTGKGCLYIKSLSDVHLPTLQAIIKKSATEKPKSK
ncbi:MAG TPA: DUF1801 domain-containing protein [Blastocatellia bacterium]|nr:DUF1801 domain-containing protein [Blastocatellia bacterium]